MNVALDSRKQFERDVVAAMPHLRRQLFALCKDQDKADDLVQETVTKAIAGWESFEDGSNLGAWLYTIGKNHFLSLYRKIDRREVEDSGEQSIAETIPVDGSQASALELKELAEAIDRLPRHMQGPIRMVAVMGHSYEETALECGIPLGTVKSQINRARLLLGEYGNDVPEAVEDEPRTDQRGVRAFLYALAKHYLAENDGNIGRATEALIERLANDRLAMQEVVTAAIREAALQASHDVVKNRRVQITRRANQGRGAVVALAAGISAALLDMPLAGGAKLRQASRELVLEEAARAEHLSKSQAHRAKWLQLIAQCIPNGKCVGDVLDDTRAQELWDEAKK